MSEQWELSGNANNVDWTDIAMAGRAYADNLLNEPTISKMMHLMADEINRLREALRRLAEQDATLSVCNGAVTVEMDGTLMPEEREAIKTVIGGFGMWVAQNGLTDDESLQLAVLTLRGLLNRLGNKE